MENSKAPTPILPILKMPLAFYGLDSRPGAAQNSDTLGKVSTYVDFLTNELKREILNLKTSNQANLPEELYNAVKAMPVALFRLPDEYEVPIALFSILHEHIYYVFHTFKSNPTPDQNLEALLAGYPEYIYYMLTDKSGKSQMLSNSQENAVRSMFGSPFWVIKWLEDNYKKETHHELMKSIYNLHEHDACSAHCFHWLKTKNMEQAARVEELTKMLSALSTQPYIALITALEYPDLEMEPLLPEVQQSPMWTYNWLRHVKKPPTPQMLQTLIKWVPWGIQYINDLHPPDADDILKQILQAPANKYWEPWIKLYQDRSNLHQT